jgi:hypothetical protein
MRLAAVFPLPSRRLPRPCFPARRLPCRESRFLALLCCVCRFGACVCRRGWGYSRRGPGAAAGVFPWRLVARCAFAGVSLPAGPVSRRLVILAPLACTIFFLGAGDLAGAGTRIGIAAVLPRRLQAAGAHRYVEARGRVASRTSRSSMRFTRSTASVVSPSSAARTGGGSGGSASAARLPFCTSLSVAKNRCSRPA